MQRQVLRAVAWERRRGRRGPERGLALVVVVVVVVLLTVRWVRVVVVRQADVSGDMRRGRGGIRVGHDRRRRRRRRSPCWNRCNRAASRSRGRGRC